MILMISLLALFILIWLILKPFILLILEQENERYEQDKRSKKD